MRSWLVVVVVLTACVSSSDPIEPQVTSGALIKRIPMSVNRKIDVLFVIDNSPAMVPYADNVRANLGKLADILRTQQGGLPDLRLGVVTTDVAADDAKLRGTTGLTGSFIVSLVGADGIRLHNYDGELADVFARLTDVGTSGGAAHPLEAARRALENPANRSFLRREAYTAIFWITASDDDSAALDATVDFFKKLHDDPTKVIVAGVLGAGDRMPAFLDRFPNRSTRASIGDADWTSVFQIIAQLYKTSLGSPCVEGPLLDVDPIAPGMQYECAVWYDFPIGGKVIPPCTGALAGECWKIVDDAQQCPSSIGSSGLFKLEQPRADLPDEVMLNLDCLSR